jgi:hypothetical protein
MDALKFESDAARQTALSTGCMAAGGRNVKRINGVYDGR